MGRSWQTLRELTQQVAPVVGRERDGNVSRNSGAEKNNRKPPKQQREKSEILQSLPCTVINTSKYTRKTCCLTFKRGAAVTSRWALANRPAPSERRDVQGHAKHPGTNPKTHLQTKKPDIPLAGWRKTEIVQRYFASFKMKKERSSVWKKTWLSLWDEPPSCRLPRSHTVFLLGASRVDRNTCAVWGKSWRGEPARGGSFCNGTQTCSGQACNFIQFECTRLYTPPCFCVLLCRLFVRFPAPLLAHPPVGGEVGIAHGCFSFHPSRLRWTGALPHKLLESGGEK